ncbi:hypothetical protein EDB83DRAFT_2310546 [Lactarius deliciosus]|nr:hypothetical protein EDB83DRAFT_2310546 [Lactarius deliciosus]
MVWGWWRLGLACRVVVSRRVAGCCTPCWDGVGVGGGWALHAVLRRRGGSWRAMLGWQGGLVVAGQDGGGSRAQMACNVQAEGLAWHVEVARWVGGGGVSGQDGGFTCCVGAAWRVGGGGVL